jgi:ADP-dependent NAD(P)H-hydrate dehydratase / NAD(P)H-hydrate epimerase
MKPVVTVEEMRQIDAAAPESVEVLIQRAGSAVAQAALRMLGGSYGRRVVVVAGKGNNGADGRVAAERLRARGVRVEVIEPGATVRAGADLVIDAAYGTGFRGSYEAPDPGGAPVLAVDIPSGVNGETGEAVEGAVRADATATFAALKPGLLLGEGPERSGRVEVADIGVDVSGARAWLVEDADVARLLPRRARNAHKWNTAVYVVAGSAGMLGAADLASRSTLRAGAGTVRLGTPGGNPLDLPPGEVVVRKIPAVGWVPDVLEDADRAEALLVGPGLGRTEGTAEAVRELVAKYDKPLVLDADGLTLLAQGDGIGVLRSRADSGTVLTPHEGEFERLTGAAPGADRVAEVRALAERSGATVLLKGATTVVADPDGRVLLATAGGPQLATAGTGDVLAGIITAFLAMGLMPLEAAGLGAHVHGAVSNLGPKVGLVAGDLIDLLPRYLSSLIDG